VGERTGDVATVTTPRAVVAGGGSGIGQACAFRLARLGYHLTLVGRDASKLAATIEQIKQIERQGGEAHAFVADVRDWDRIAELAMQVGEPGLDLLINSAGGQFTAPSAELSQNGWRAVVETNLNGSFFLCRHLLPALRKRQGAVVTVVANLWQRATPGLVHSAAARAAVVSMTRTLALEWAPSGVRLNAVSPGVTDTIGLQRYPHHREVLATVPLGRAATADEIAEAILFMGQSRYITGEVLTIDGGLQLV
jgi:citronellol/citronellal dehydrogenase